MYTCSAVHFSMQIAVVTRFIFKDTHRGIISRGKIDISQGSIFFAHLSERHCEWKILCGKCLYLGIFRRSALGFGGNHISKSFSTPSKKLGLILFNKLLSAIYFQRNFRYLIPLSASNNSVTGLEMILHTLNFTLNAFK